MKAEPVVLIDTRDPAIYAEAHIPGAVDVMFKSRAETLAECATVGVTPETPVIVYCFKGARASNTFVALEEAGIKNVGIYFGSWNEWSRDPSLPIEEGLPYPPRIAA